MQGLWPRPDFESIPKSLLLLGCFYFLYEAALQYLLLLMPIGPGVILPADQATLLRDSKSLALSFLSLGAFFLFLTAWQPAHLRTFVVVLLVSKATLLALWHTPAPLAVTVLVAVVPLVLLSTLVFLAFRFQRARKSAP